MARRQRMFKDLTPAQKSRKALLAKIAYAEKRKLQLETRKDRDEVRTEFLEKNQRILESLLYLVELISDSDPVAIPRRNINKHDGDIWVAGFNQGVKQLKKSIFSALQRTGILERPKLPNPETESKLHERYPLIGDNPECP